MLALAGYLYRVPSFYEVGLFTPMALNASVAFLVLSAGILFAGAPKGHGDHRAVLHRPDGKLMTNFARPVPQ